MKAKSLSFLKDRQAIFRLFFIMVLFFYISFGELEGTYSFRKDSAGLIMAVFKDCDSMDNAATTSTINRGTKNIQMLKSILKA